MVHGVRNPAFSHQDIGSCRNQLAPGMRAVAYAPDGTIEAIHMPGAPGFNLGVQWHPEWCVATNETSMAMTRPSGIHRVLQHDLRTRNTRGQ